jgi:hypothetical protein
MLRCYLLQKQKLCLTDRRHIDKYRCFHKLNKIDAYHKLNKTDEHQFYLTYGKHQFNSMCTDIVELEMSISNLSRFYCNNTDSLLYLIAINHALPFYIKTYVLSFRK